jgi:hypothetical protein
MPALVERAQAFATLDRGARRGDRPGRWSSHGPSSHATRHEDFYQIWDAAGAVLGRAASNQGRDLEPPAGAYRTYARRLFDLVLPDGHRGRGVLLAVWPRHATATRKLPWTVVVASEREATRRARSAAYSSRPAAMASPGALAVDVGAVAGGGTQRA